MNQLQRLHAAVDAISHIDVPDLRTQEMLTALGYIAGEIIRTSRDPERVLSDYVTLLRQHVRNSTQH